MLTLLVLASASLAPDTSGPQNRHDWKSPVRKLIARGDFLFEKAMEHLRASDPNINPKGWLEENRKALGLFTKANREGYTPASELFSRESPAPKKLFSKIRETTMREALCRKRMVRHR